MNIYLSLEGTRKNALFFIYCGMVLCLSYFMKYYIHIVFLICFSILAGCQKNSTQVDLIVHNAKVYSVDSVFSVNEAFAVRNGRFVAVGTSSKILSSYQSDSVWDAAGQAIYPGFIDPHSHFFALGAAFNEADLTNTNSFDEVVERLKEFRNKHKDKKWLIGRGWDQNDWEDKEFPDKVRLDEVFPDIPIFLVRIDGHAALVNSKALEVAEITSTSRIEGGVVMLSEGQPTGILIDNAMSLVTNRLPVHSVNEKKEMLKAAEKACFSVGLTSVSDAGIDRSDIELLDRMHKDGTLKIRDYVMVNATSDNLDFYLAKGVWRTDRLSVSAFKLFADGALGSRGALLLDAYSDDDYNHGLPLKSTEQLEKTISRISGSKFQVNTHCIGDSANRLVLQLYGKFLKGRNDRRWRIEHAQVVDKNDLQMFREYSIIPSIQPTHATSDMQWATERLGKDRIANAYAYKDLLVQNGMIALGSDFPVENYNPLLGFFAAIARTDENGLPSGGFQKQNALNREEALRGMTIWAAYSNFEEKVKGSIEVGKWADFVVLDQDIMEIPERDILTVKVVRTVISGDTVFLNSTN